MTEMEFRPESAEDGTALITITDVEQGAQGKVLATGTLSCQISTGSVPSLPSLAGAVTSIIFVATKLLSRQTRVCCLCLSRQTRVCRDKTLLSQQKYACVGRDKTRLLSRRKCVCHDKSKLVATKVLSISTCLSRQKSTKNLSGPK